MKQSLRAAALLALTVLTHVAHAQDADPMMFSMDNSYDPEEWMYVATSRSGTTRTIRAKDQSQISTTGRVWVKDDHTKDATERARETRTLMEIDCRNETLKVMSMVAYDRNGATIKSLNVPLWEQRSQPIVPQSMGDTIRRFVCAPA